MALLVTDPVCFRRDENWDLKFPLELASGLEAAAIGVRSRLGLAAGEVFANQEVGMPWIANDVVDERAAILGAAYDPLKVRVAMRREALTTPGVVDLPVLDSAFNGETRTLSITFVARTAWGDTRRVTFEQGL